MVRLLGVTILNLVMVNYPNPAAWKPTCLLRSGTPLALSRQSAVRAPTARSDLLKVLDARSGVMKIRLASLHTSCRSSPHFRASRRRQKPMFTYRSPISEEWALAAYEFSQVL